MNCCVVPNAIDGFVGVTKIETNTAAVTVSVLESSIPLAGSVAVIVVKPIATLVANPLLPGALLIVATVLIDELQVAELVRSCVELSL